jgi:hypothetical protein
MTMTPPLPVIVRQDNPRWPWVVGERWKMKLPSHIPFFAVWKEYTKESIVDVKCWVSCEGDTIFIEKGYAFDGVSSPVLKSRLDAIPGLLASALLHDAALQAISEDVHWLEYRHATRLFRMGLEAFDVPRRDFYVALVESWFNPFFNLFRKR